MYVRAKYRVVSRPLQLSEGWPGAESRDRYQLEPIPNLRKNRARGLDKAVDRLTKYFRPIEIPRRSFRSTSPDVGEHGTDSVYAEHFAVRGIATKYFADDAGVGIRRLQYDRARAIAKKNSRTSIVPVHKLRQRICPNNDCVAHSAASNQRRTNRKSIHKTSAGGIYVHSAGTVRAEQLLHTREPCSASGRRRYKTRE